MKYEDTIKRYFQEEINLTDTPPFPRQNGKTRTNWKDILATAACVALVVAVLINPASQKTRIRSIHLSSLRYEEITGRISRAFYEAAPYMY